MIKILDTKTINQIAAGEVIERPANIVKELIENAIDAHADRITVEIENGGIDKIIVKDNGDGFEKDDIALAFHPHATSKLTKIDDLKDIYTYGFRGEALASISLVSNVTLITKQRNSLKTYQINSDNGLLSTITETSGVDGTKIIVEDLFKKIPARRKFLKTASVEASKIYDIVEKISLSRKDISFRFISDKRERFLTPGNNKINSIIYTLYGKEVSENLIDIDTKNNDVHITGVIAKPIIGKNNRNEEIFFVNGRYVKNEILYKAVEEAYRNYIMQHKFPFVILNIDVNGELIDVNAHPQKIEIRFSNKLDIYDIVKNAVLDALKNTILINKNNYNSISLKNQQSNSLNINELKSLYDIENENIDDNKLGFDNFKDEPSNSKPKSLFEDLLKSASVQKSLYEYFNDDLDNDENILDNNDLIPKKAINPNRNYKYIGQVFNTYLLFEVKDKIIFLDQHAVHEKINYEKFIDMINNDNIKTQKIMPIVITLNAMQYTCLKENIEEFRSIGYDIEFFGDKDIIVEGVPLFLAEIVDNQFIVEMIDKFSNDKDLSNYDSIKDKIATISCKASIKANQKVTENEAYELVEQLFKLKNPYNCPHGRPTMIEFTKLEFDKRFKRIVN